MRESLMYGSVRGARGNSRPDRDRRELITLHVMPDPGPLLAKVSGRGRAVQGAPSVLTSR
jgi:hypothetical protein